jgi:hypothetical protein
VAPETSETVPPLKVPKVEIPEAVTETVPPLMVWLGEESVFTETLPPEIFAVRLELVRLTVA